MRARRSLLPVLALALLAAGPLAARAQDATPAATGSLAVVASGLTNPRGFGWGPDGQLYLALAGWGGDTKIAAAPGFTASIGLSSSVVTVADGCTTPLVRGLVSAKWEEAGWVWGAMDVAFLDGDPYVLVSGAGPTWASPTSRSGVFKLNSDGTMTLVADLTTWKPEHPPKSIPPDYNADGSLFDLEAAGDSLYLADAVGGQVLKVTPAGEISIVADLSEGHPVPTGLAVADDGTVYVGYENAIPYPNGSSKVSKIAPDGAVTDAWTGLTRVSDVVLGPDGALYAAELSTNNTDTEPYVHPGTGRVVKQTGPDSLEVLVDGLDFPVGLGFGPDGALYVDGPANGANNGEGWLARVETGGTPSPAPSPTSCPPPATPTAA
jgi:SMP-30/Gluconolactonase/LRE-like region